jgi:hypothetical protein
MTTTARVTIPSLTFTLVDDCEAFDVSQLNPALGNIAYVKELDAQFELKVSSATVDHTAVLSVTGIGGLRWLLANAGTVQSVTGAGVDNTDPNNPVLVAATMGAAIGAANTETDTLIAAGTSIGGGIALLGNTDGNYRIDFDLIAGTGGTGDIAAKPNNLTTNQINRGVYYSASAPGGFGGTDLVLETNTASGNHVVGTLWVTSKAGRQRFFKWELFGDQGNIAKFGAGKWTDTDAEITSLPITCATAAGFAIGSTYTITKLNQVG